MNKKESEAATRRIKEQDAAARRIIVDAGLTNRFLIGTGYITIDTAKDIGVINLRGVIENLDLSQGTIQWMRVVTKKQQMILFYFKDRSSCEHCGKFAVTDDGMDECSECHTFQSVPTQSTREAALVHANRVMKGGYVEHTYGEIEEIWDEL